MLARAFVAVPRETCESCGGRSTDGISDREREVLALAASSYRNKEIAHHLGITSQTTKNHMTNILKKTGNRDRTGAVMLALEAGWIKRV